MREYFYRLCHPGEKGKGFIFWNITFLFFTIELELIFFIALHLQGLQRAHLLTSTSPTAFLSAASKKKNVCCKQKDAKIPLYNYIYSIILL